MKVLLKNNHFKIRITLNSEYKLFWIAERECNKEEMKNSAICIQRKKETPKTQQCRQFPPSALPIQ